MIFRCAQAVVVPAWLHSFIEPWRAWETVLVSCLHTRPVLAITTINNSMCLQEANNGVLRHSATCQAGQGICLRVGCITHMCLLRVLDCLRGRDLCWGHTLQLVQLCSACFVLPWIGVHGTAVPCRVLVPGLGNAPAELGCVTCNTVIRPADTHTLSNPPTNTACHTKEHNTGSAYEGQVPYPSTNALQTLPNLARNRPSCSKEGNSSRHSIAASCPSS